MIASSKRAELATELYGHYRGTVKSKYVDIAISFVRLALAIPASKMILIRWRGCGLPRLGGSHVLTCKSMHTGSYCF